MVQLPSNLAIYRQDAENSLARGLVKDVEFSSGTYQVLVEDIHSHLECWVFIQLEGKGQIRDAFCSCEKHEMPEEPCLHIAVAYLSLFGNHSQPLHQRFSRSLWNHLCRLYADHLGGDPSVLIRLQPGYYVYQSAGEKVIFSIKGLTENVQNKIDQLIVQRPQETEETSLKFSNLPNEELLLWREGNPSPQLSYDISYWSDLAKWLLNTQEGQVPYKINFTYSKKGLPNRIQAKFSEVEVSFYISEANLPLIIPSLATVKSSLAVRNSYDQGITRITYDKTVGELHIEADPKVDLSKSKKKKETAAGGISIEGWTFMPNDGFYAEEAHVLLQHPVLEGESLSEVLTDHKRIISDLLVDEIVHSDPVTISYKLFFDKGWNLHIEGYLFEPGDLTTGDSRLFGSWAYLDHEGFYPVEGKRFEESENIIPLYQVAEFVTQNRAWFNTQEGFQTHVKSIEYQLTYQINANNRLTFSRTLMKTKEGSTQDFGAWVYVEGHGFYSKTAGSFNFLLKPGISLSAEQIPLFIKMNRDELSLIPGFFNERCPVANVSLKVLLGDKRSIHIEPVYELLPQHPESAFKVFDDFVYVEGKGFYELPSNLRLPEKFRHTMEIEGEEVDLFIAYELGEIYKQVSYLDPRLEKPQELKVMTNVVEAAPDKGRGWYRFSIYFETEKGVIPVSNLYTALKKKKQQFGFFEAGAIDLKDKRFDWLKHLNKDRLEKSPERVLLTTLEFMRINAFDPLNLVVDPAHPKTQEVFDELTNLHTPEEPDVGGLVSHLRPYQEIGVRWLWFLYHQHLSGLLCDDMGLGKTHQAMALLASVKNFYRSFAEGTPHHFLVVCPTSVIYHWQEKLHQFLPGARVCTFYGNKRSLEEFHEQYDVLLTSYGVLRNEKDLLSKLSFEVAVFDEIQVAKNQLSRVYAALSRVKANMKLGLTGTPIENHLRELKSLFDIVLPTYMPGENEYREFFIRPIEKEHNPHRKELLNRFIRPFTLRRKKEDVLKELPEKIEEIAYCDLDAYQSQLYTEVLELRRRHLIEELQNESNPVPYLHIFSLLSSLKQICDHPAVYLKTPLDYQKYSSGKWSLFLELLREARESQQKVVVFSQYLGMLDIIEHYLTDQNIGFASLRGATQNRKVQLQRFNQDPSCKVFVGSLQAAGLGVDLTAGSVVIHYDRWWNAARENQATDRVHRIGQTRGVQVFKLVTKGTFEEKIDAMILRKGQLMEEVVGIDDQNSLKKFSREDLMDLLSLVEMNTEHLASDLEM